jgi:hypothetical protein
MEDLYLYASEWWHMKNRRKYNRPLNSERNLVLLLNDMEEKKKKKECRMMSDLPSEEEEIDSADEEYESEMSKESEDEVGSEMSEDNSTGLEDDTGSLEEFEEDDVERPAFGRSKSTAIIIEGRN